MEALAWLIIFVVILYIYNNYGSAIKKAFWRWITEKSPYFKVSKKFSLTDKALRKYTSEALIRKVMELEAEVEKLRNTLKEIEEKATKQKEYKEEIDKQTSEEINNIMSTPTLIKPARPIRVYDADGVFRGYLDSIKGTFSEAYVLVRTEDNELLIFGPDDITNLILNETSLSEQLKSGILMIAYDRYNRKVSPEYVRVSI